MANHLVAYLEQGAQVALVWGPLLILALMALESSVFPLPSEVVMIPAGFMAARHELFPGNTAAAIAIAIVAGTVGSVVGAYANYFVSLKLGRPILHRYGKWVFLSSHALDRVEEIFREYGDVSTFIGRLLPGVRHLISIPAGLSRMNFARFTFFTAVGAAIWVTILTVVGYDLGRRSAKMTYAELVSTGTKTMHENLVWIVLGCAAVLAAYVWTHKRVMRSKKGA